MSLIGGADCHAYLVWGCGACIHGGVDASLNLAAAFLLCKGQTEFVSSCPWLDCYAFQRYFCYFAVVDLDTRYCPLILTPFGCFTLKALLRCVFRRLRTTGFALAPRRFSVRRVSAAVSPYAELESPAALMLHTYSPFRKTVLAATRFDGCSCSIYLLLG